VHPGNAYIDIAATHLRADQIIAPGRGGQAMAVGIYQRQQVLLAVEKSDAFAASQRD
jgi:hypothetical protein